MQFVNTPISFSGAFSDPGVFDTHTATWTFSTAELPDAIVSATVSGNTVSDLIEFFEPGVYFVTLTVTDDDGASGFATTVGDNELAYVVVIDPNGGWLNSEPGAYALDSGVTGKPNFGFVVNYNKKNSSLPNGNLEFNFQEANLDFKSAALDWLVVQGARAQVQGSGTINGIGDAVFVLTVLDGGGMRGKQTDQLRLQIWDRESWILIYDNQPGDGLNAPLIDKTNIQGGSIVVH